MHHLFQANDMLHHPVVVHRFLVILWFMVSQEDLKIMDDLEVQLMQIQVFYPKLFLKELSEVPLRHVIMLQRTPFQRSGCRFVVIINQRLNVYTSS